MIFSVITIYKCITKPGKVIARWLRETPPVVIPPPTAKNRPTDQQLSDALKYLANKGISKEGQRRNTITKSKI